MASLSSWPPILQGALYGIFMGIVWTLSSQLSVSALASINNGASQELTVRQTLYTALWMSVGCALMCAWMVYPVGILNELPFENSYLFTKQELILFPLVLGALYGVLTELFRNA